MTLDPKALEVAHTAGLAESKDTDTDGFEIVKVAIQAYLDAADLVTRSELVKAVNEREITRTRLLKERDEARRLAADNGKMIAALQGALNLLMLEAKSFMGFEDEIAPVTGWTNIHCLKERIEQARAVLTDTAAAAAQWVRVEWKAIEEHQPPPHETILFLCSNGDIYQGRPCYGMHAPWWCGHSKLNFGKVLEEEGLVVTHWIPKLVAPKAGEPEGE